MEIERILSFDGNGNVAVYLCDGATFGDLNGLSNEKIIELAKEQDRAVFEAGGSRRLSKTPRRPSKRGSNATTPLKAEADAGTYDSMNNYGAYGIEGVPRRKSAAAIEEFQIALENTKSSLDAANEGQAFNEAAGIRSRSPSPTRSRSKPTARGNVAAGEEIRFLARRFSFYQIEVDDTTDLESPKTRFRVLADYGWHNDAEIPGERLQRP